MRVIAVIQARTGSTRLPGKVLAVIGDRPLIAWTVAALRAVPGIDVVVLATSDEPADDALATPRRSLRSSTAGRRATSWPGSGTRRPHAPTLSSAARPTTRSPIPG